MDILALKLNLLTDEQKMEYYATCGGDEISVEDDLYFKNIYINDGEEIVKNQEREEYKCMVLRDFMLDIYLKYRC
jgi:hypothetical protein